MSFTSIKINLLQRFSLNFSANIISAVWMLLGSVKAFEWVKPTVLQFVAFLVVALSANVLFAYLVSDFSSSLNIQGLIDYLIWPTIMLLAGIILARRSHNDALTFMPAILWLTADSILMFIQSLIQFLASQNLLPMFLYDYMTGLFLAVFVWNTASLLLIFAKKLNWAWWERILMLAGAIAMLVVWQKNVADEPIFKLPVHNPVVNEQAFYEQPKLFNNAIDKIETGKIGVSEWYFMGVAGYADLDVFASEIDAARQLFDVRFGTKGRSLALINNRYTWLDEPIATRTSIASGLKAIGKKMNTEEDVLFLTLTSHGIVGDNHLPTGELALDNPPIDMQPIDGKWLREALDNSGIRWRVIVVSACYSGAFIEDLASPTTLIVTASSADRASFGCTHDADLTYFGRAFFAESMRLENSFDKAFLLATRKIAERESLKGLPASHPQMVTGELIKTALPEFEKVLFGHGITPADNSKP